jgi:hypothetical protein
VLPISKNVDARIHVLEPVAEGESTEEAEQYSLPEEEHTSRPVGIDTLQHPPLFFYDLSETPLTNLHKLSPFFSCTLSVRTFEPTKSKMRTG